MEVSRTNEIMLVKSFIYDVSNCNANDGTLTAVADSANGAVSYLWSPGGYTTASSCIFSYICPKSCVFCNVLASLFHTA